MRPLRAKHCAVTGRCVAMFDHFCPWVGNCIGAGNRHYFAGFLWLELGAILIAGSVLSCGECGVPALLHWFKLSTAYKCHHSRVPSRLPVLVLGTNIDVEVELRWLDPWRLQG